MLLCSAVKPLRVSLIKPVAYLNDSYLTSSLHFRVAESSAGSMSEVGLSRDGDNERAAVSEADPAFRLFKTGPVGSREW
jgi:hypothetical protein